MAGFLAALRNVSAAQTRKIYLCCSIVVLLLGLFSHLDAIGLRAEEPRRAMVGMEVLEYGSWWIPTIHGETYYNKPPFYNWVMAGSFFLTQTYSEWAVRLPGVLSFLGTALLLFVFVRHYHSSKLAVLAALAYLTSADLLFYGSVNAGEIDLFYSLITLLQVLAIFHFFQKGRWWFLFTVSYAFAAVGVLTKGLPTVAFQGLTLLPFLLIKKQGKMLFSLQHLAGLAVFTVVVGGYLWIYAQHEDLAAFLTNQFKEGSQRTANESGLGKIIAQIFQFPVQVMQLLLPWSLFLVLAFNRQRFREVFRNPAFGYLGLFLAANIWLYWISPDMRNRYLYMFLPLITVLLVAFYEQTHTDNKAKKWVTKVLVGATWLCPLAFMAFPFIQRFNPDIQIPAVASWVFAAVLLVICWINTQANAARIWGVFLVMAIVRLGVNFCWTAHFHQHAAVSTYYQNVDAMLDIAGDAPIYLTGPPFVFEPDIQVAGEEVYRNRIETPPLIPYAIPYHFVKRGHAPISYMKVPQGNAFFIGPVGYMPELAKAVHYRFRDSWQNRDMMFFSLQKTK